MLVLYIYIVLVTSHL